MTSAMAADLRPGDPATSAASATLSTRVEKSYATDAEGRPFSAAEFAGGKGGAGTYTLPTGSPGSDRRVPVLLGGGKRRGSGER
jgi:hypothetical protein